MTFKHYFKTIITQEKFDTFMKAAESAYEVSLSLKPFEDYEFAHSDLKNNIVLSIVIRTDVNLITVNLKHADAMGSKILETKQTYIQNLNKVEDINEWLYPLLCNQMDKIILANMKTKPASNKEELGMGAFIDLFSKVIKQ